MNDGDVFTVGKPTTGSTVSGKILNQGREDKVLVVKYKNKIRYKKTRGHRQHFTEVQIEKIS